MDIHVSIAVLDLYISKLYPNSQVKEDDIWKDLDGQKLMEHVGSDNATKTYIKQKTMEIVGKVLESRKNPQGYALQSLSLQFNEITCSLVMTLVSCFILF